MRPTLSALITRHESYAMKVSKQAVPFFINTHSSGVIIKKEEGD
ncbi:hypothetical protein OBP_015 [Pseudomonas phage OBP]|nr:hypothetical protein OBP_015 [Pseudomonas phage OBP]AEV89452.1 hypothetical protein OBP_015 [Pseudomonas phage OBP]